MVFCIFKLIQIINSCINQSNENRNRNHVHDDIILIFHIGIFSFKYKNIDVQYVIKTL